MKLMAGVIYGQRMITLLKHLQITFNISLLHVLINFVVDSMCHMQAGNAYSSRASDSASLTIFIIMEVNLINTKTFLISISSD